PLQVDPVAGPQLAEVGPPQRLGARLEGEGGGVVGDDGEAGAVDGDALAQRQLRCDARLGDDEPTTGALGGALVDGPQGLDKTGEHVSPTSPACAPPGCGAAPARSGSGSGPLGRRPRTAGTGPG